MAEMLFIRKVNVLERRQIEKRFEISILDVDSAGFVASPISVTVQNSALTSYIEITPSVINFVGNRCGTDFDLGTNDLKRLRSLSYRFGKEKKTRKRRGRVVRVNAAKDQEIHPSSNARKPLFKGIEPRPFIGPLDPGIIVSFPDHARIEGARMALPGGKRLDSRGGWIVRSGGLKNNSDIISYILEGYNLIWIFFENPANG